MKKQQTQWDRVAHEMEIFRMNSAQSNGVITENLDVESTT